MMNRTTNVDAYLNRLINEAVSRTIGRRLNEYYNPLDGINFGDDEFDDFSGHDFGGDDFDADDFEVPKSPKGGTGKPSSPKKPVGNDTNYDELSRQFSRGNEGFANFEDIDNFEDEDDEIDSDKFPKPAKTGNALYDDAMDKLYDSDGFIDKSDWMELAMYGGENGEEVPYSQKEASAAFDAAKKEYERLSSEFEADEAPAMSDRPMGVQQPQPQQPAEPHKAGNVIEYDGIEIKDDGTQYSMIAKVSNPEITIKGSNLEEVKNKYNELWRNFSNMGENARKIGFTDYHGAWLWYSDYEKFVVSAGGHEENLPVIVDLDKIASRHENMTPHTATGTAQSSWIDRFKQENGKYRMTKQQYDALSAEQKAQWDRLHSNHANMYNILKRNN